MTETPADFADMTLDELRVALAPDIAASAIFDGWNETALVAAAEMAGCDVDVAKLAFPEKPMNGRAMDMIEAWITSVDEAMEKTSTIAEAAASPAPQPSCEMDPNDPMLGFEAMDPMAFIDAPDGEPARATAVIEHWLVGRLSRQDIPAPLTKTFCQIGITNMITDYHHPVADDDAVIGVAYRAIYSWNAEAEFPGWQLTQLGLRMECARGMNMETKLCL